MTHRPRWWSLTILTVLLAVLAAACSDVDEGSNEERPTGSDGGTTTADCGSDTVNIAVNPWTGSAVNANVAKVIMEQELGCTVELRRHRRVRAVPGDVRRATSTPRSRCGRPVTRRTTRSTSTEAKGSSTVASSVSSARSGGSSRPTCSTSTPSWRPGKASTTTPSSSRRPRPVDQGPDAGRRPELRVLRRGDRREPRARTTRSWWRAPRRRSWRSSRRPSRQRAAAVLLRTRRTGRNAEVRPDGGRAARL